MASPNTETSCYTFFREHSFSLLTRWGRGRLMASWNVGEIRNYNTSQNTKTSVIKMNKCQIVILFCRIHVISKQKFRRVARPLSGTMWSYTQLARMLGEDRQQQCPQESRDCDRKISELEPSPVLIPRTASSYSEISTSVKWHSGSMWYKSNVLDAMFRIFYIK